MSDDEAEALKRKLEQARRLRERLEQPRPLLVAQTDAAVAHSQGDTRRAVAERTRRGAHLDAPLVGELQRVGQQIEQDLPHSRGIADQGIVELDEERKASMVSNLLVVLCGDQPPSPVVNAGSLYT